MRGEPRSSCDTFKRKFGLFRDTLQKVRVRGGKRILDRSGGKANNENAEKDRNLPTVCLNRDNTWCFKNWRTVLKRKW